MASEANQTFKFNNFQEILSYYATLLKNAMLEEASDNPFKLEKSESSSSSGEFITPFLPKEWIEYELDEITGNQIKKIIPNQGYTYGQSILTAFEDTSNQIRDSLMTLFINYDDKKELWQEDLNFNLLNAYASASQSLQWYNKDTEEFEDMPEYWFTRGCWYEMLPMCTKGEYIKAYHVNVMNAVKAIKKCRDYFENEFEYFVMEPTTDYGSYYSYDGGYTSYSSTVQRRVKGARQASYSTYGNSKLFIRAFWQYYLKTLKDEVEKLLKPIWKFGEPTNYPEQTASTAKLTYVTQMVTDVDTVYITGNTCISTAKALSSQCGTYDAKAAKLKLSK